MAISTESGWTPIQDFVSQNVGTLRKSAGMSRQELIERLDRMAGVEMHPTTLRRIENGEQQPKVLEAVAFARVFQVPVERLVSEPINPALSDVHTYMSNCREAVKDLLNEAQGVPDFLGEAIETLATASDPEVINAEATRDLWAFLKSHAQVVRDAIQLRNDAGLETEIRMSKGADGINPWWEEGNFPEIGSFRSQN
ncbi:MAG: helix-turn-helix transcriptional regulator [Corynebacterium sp.]|uniref:helix-turn-helix domain-containing protein n=1 Tax=Corynebacterium sp. TaxID=1720 RepID=UPI0026DCE43B|nr:helix-turn-helix transcriptional regulator [Corynebacterium sp.]MDO5030415.1 helix-turn-helix transcriptional regulator [Corynebacterium sp.]